MCEILLFVIISASLIFTGGDPLVLFECADKIAQVIEPVPVCDLCDGVIGGGQLAAGLFDPLAVEIIHRGLVGHLGKEPAEILGRHGDRSGKLLQGNRVCLVLIDKFHHLLQLDDTFVITSGFPQTFQVVMITKNQSEKVVKLSDYRKLISRHFFIHRLNKRKYCRKNIQKTLVKVVKNQNILVADLLDVIRAYGIQLQKYVHIKDNELIDTIDRTSGMQDSAVDKNHITLHCFKTFFV